MPTKCGHGTSRNQVWGPKEIIDDGLFLTRIVVTKDDILRQLSNMPEYHHLCVKEPIIVDIYI